MNETAPMGFAQTASNLPDDSQALRNAEPADDLESPCERFASQVLHGHEIVLAGHIRDWAVIEKYDDVRVLESREDACFEQKAASEALLGFTLAIANDVDHLQGHRPPEGRLGREIHAPHSAPRDSPDDLKAPVDERAHESVRENRVARGVCGTLGHRASPL